MNRAGSRCRKGVSRMEVVIRGEATEIAALVVAIQERRDLGVCIDAKNLVRAICDIGPGVRWNT